MNPEASVSSFVKSECNMYRSESFERTPMTLVSMVELTAIVFLKHEMVCSKALVFLCASIFSGCAMF